MNFLKNWAFCWQFLRNLREYTSKMQLWCLLVAFGAIAICHAIPVSKKDSVKAEADLRQLEFADAYNDNTQSVRSGRQGGGFYDYFAYQNQNPSEYYQQSYYPDYFGSYYDSMAYQPQPPRRPSTININSSPLVYPSRRKYNQRRKNIEASTQRWTVWDLARKWVNPNQQQQCIGLCSLCSESLFITFNKHYRDL